MVKVILILALFLVGLGSFQLLQPWLLPQSSPEPHNLTGNQTSRVEVATNATGSSGELLTELPPSKVLINDYHIFQTFNNCGPAALSMALSYYGVSVDQGTLGQQLRPYQHPTGDNDDKSVTLAELADHAETYGLISYHRPGGNMEVLQQLLAQDLPVITRTWLEVDDDIGHYRVVKGYDETTQELIQDDSLQGKNLRYSYSEFNQIWSKFNYEYLVLVPPEKQAQVEAILGENADPQAAWQNAANHARELLDNNPGDRDARFNLSIALYHLGQYQAAVEEFERVESQLAPRTLWYQIEPIQAYYQLGEYQRVFELTDKVLNNHNRAFSELYIIRGDIYRQQGQSELAASEYQKAERYNRNSPLVKARLSGQYQ